MAGTGILLGGCLCGAVRYEVILGADVGADVVDYCHCRQCRKASGAPVTAWMQVSPDRFQVTKGATTPFASSSAATRWFCPACGSPIYMTDASEKSVGITLGTLDEPGAVSPTVHGWYDERAAWLRMADSLPRFAKSPPYDL